MTTESATLLQTARKVIGSTRAARPTSASAAMSTAEAGLKPPSTAGLWLRCSAFLTRQALEASLDDFWVRRQPGVEQSNMRAQLLCLGAFLGDESLASRVAHAWSALSNACHHHSYELAPTVGELEGWIETVREFGEKCKGVR